MTDFFDTMKALGRERQAAIVARGDRDSGCRCWAFEMDLYEDGEAVEGWYGPKCPHHPPVEVSNG